MSYLSGQSVRKSHASRINLNICEPKNNNLSEKFIKLKKKIFAMFFLIVALPACEYKNEHPETRQCEFKGPSWERVERDRIFWAAFHLQKAEETMKTIIENEIVYRSDPIFRSMNNDGLRAYHHNLYRDLRNKAELFIKCAGYANARSLGLTPAEAYARSWR
jgi:hypothetical protein